MAKRSVESGYNGQSKYRKDHFSRERQGPSKSVLRSQRRKAALGMKNDGNVSRGKSGNDPKTNQ